MERIETQGGHLYRIIHFINKLCEAGQRGDFSLVFKIGVKQETHEPAIGIAIDDGPSHAFTIAEGKHLADLCEETLEDGSYEEIGDHIKKIIADIRETVARAEQHHSACLSRMLTKH